MSNDKTGPRIVSFTIENQSYLNKPRARVSFEGYGNEIKLDLDPELAHQMLSVCREALLSAMDNSLGNLRAVIEKEIPLLGTVEDADESPAVDEPVLPVEEGSGTEKGPY